MGSDAITVGMAKESLVVGMDRWNPTWNAIAPKGIRLTADCFNAAVFDLKVTSPHLSACHWQTTALARQAADVGQTMVDRLAALVEELADTGLPGGVNRQRACDWNNPGDDRVPGPCQKASRPSKNPGSPSTGGQVVHTVHGCAEGSARSGCRSPKPTYGRTRWPPRWCGPRHTATRRSQPW